MTPKFKAIISGAISALAGFIAYLATVPPEQQSGILAQFVEITPVEWRPGVGLVTKALSTFLGFYAIYHASHSGPAAPAIPPSPIPPSIKL